MAVLTIALSERVINHTAIRLAALPLPDNNMILCAAAHPVGMAQYSSSRRQAACAYRN
jgi:hypothetical protein